MQKFSRLDYEEAKSVEWLLTNGKGGYASSTLAGCNTRRYHGLLVAATGHDRRLVWAKAEVSLYLAGASFFLGANEYLEETIHPRGYRYLLSAEVDPVRVKRYYQVGKILFSESITMAPGANLTIINYHLIDAPCEVELVIDPLVNQRSYHHVTQGELPLVVRGGQNHCLVSLPEREEKLLLILAGGEFFQEEDWYRNFYYSLENARGLEDWENHFCPGHFRIKLEPGEETQLAGGLVRTEQDLKLIEEADYFQVLSQKRRNQETYFQHLQKHWEEKGVSYRQVEAIDPILWPRLLQLADGCRSFLVEIEGHQDIVAGYPWFTQWGRDSMISLPGICLVTGNYQAARKILLSYAEHIQAGLVPNRFQEEGGAAYNTVDAGLWFIISLFEYLVQTQDREFMKQVWPRVVEIITSYFRGTRYNIHADGTGLLFAGEPGFQLTWMDAKIGAEVVTPRMGFPVEVNALWYNALQIGAKLASQMGRSDLAFRWGETADLLQQTFSREFWNHAEGCLYDLITPSGEKDPAIRPNQLLAVSLPHPLISKEKAKSVVEQVWRHLYLPGGLRSLAPGDPNYHHRYQGTPAERDAAYHQGTAWVWLLGPFIRAYLKVNDWSKEAVWRGKLLLDPVLANLREAGVGHLSEILEPEYPHEPRGCPAQAWSEAEVLRAYIEDVLPPLCRT
ncbi:MAG: glycogen debranching enzyme family protein [Firmicutes bacterium]|nr:glycogen debranching enzyme family protein [Bacillota bacterium]